MQNQYSSKRISKLQLAGKCMAKQLEKPAKFPNKTTYDTKHKHIKLPVDQLEDVLQASL